MSEPIARPEVRGRTADGGRRSAGTVDVATAPEAGAGMAAASGAGGDVAAEALGRHRRTAPEPESRGSSVLDHPATMVALSVLALLALVVGLDSASQGRLWALVPAFAVVGIYVVVVRRRRR